MGKNKKKPTAFSEFMHYLIAEERKNGRNHPKEKWSQIAAPLWEKLSENEKERYKQMAISSIAVKSTSQDVRVAAIEESLRLKAERKAFMERKVRQIVENGFINNDISKKPFYFIMANYFYTNLEGKFSPAEIACIQFNFSDGILKKYHTLVNPGKVETGYAYDARHLSETTHKIVPPPRATGETDFDQIFKQILNMIGVEEGKSYDKYDERRPCLFILNGKMKMMLSILTAFNENWNQFFDVFDLEILFNAFKNRIFNTNDVPVPTSVTSIYIECDSYDLEVGISCDFHEEVDAINYCALSYVVRWFYLFTDHICEKIGIELVGGIHLPKNKIIQKNNLN